MIRIKYLNVVLLRMLSLITLLCCWNIVFGQINKPNKGEYRHLDLYPLVSACGNCKDTINVPEFLCGHNYRTIFGSIGWSRHSAQYGLGYAWDKSNCNPFYGTNYISISTIASRLNSKQVFTNDLQLTYLRDNFFGVQFYYLKFGVSATCHTNFKEVNFSLQPEIRLSDNMDYSQLLRRINITYSYRIAPFGMSELAGNRIHQFGMILKLREKGSLR